MGTKTEPGDYDCYAKLEPDEPYFLLRGKDPVAPYLTMMWAASRNGDWSGMLDLVESMRLSKDVNARVSTDENPKLAEANSCARTMRAWFDANVCPHGVLRRKPCNMCEAMGPVGRTRMAGDLTVEHEDGSKD
jgi:hypothetical protein